MDEKEKLDENSARERAFLSLMADEVRRNHDPQLMDLVRACEGRAAVLQQCLGECDNQKKHAAIMGSTLALDLNFMMNSHEVLPDRIDYTPWSLEDTLRVRYHYELDPRKGEIRVLPQAVRAEDGSHYDSVDFLEIVVHFAVPETPETASVEPETSPLILP